MPRGRSGGRSGSFGSRSFSTSARRPSTPPRAPPPAKAPAKTTGGNSPGLFKQMAATAGGVAAGTVIGHALIGALSPSERRDHYESTYARASPNQLKEDPCGEYLQRLITCMKMAQESELNMAEVCEKSEKLYLDCREKNGEPTY